MPETTATLRETREGFGLWDALALAFVAFLMTVVLAASWGRWLDPILDVGRDLYIPEKLVAGKQLYRDFQYQFPPVAPYLLALGTLITGSDLPGYTLMGCAVGFVVALTLFFLVRGLAGSAAAATAAALFVTLNLTAASNWGSNFIFPYAHAATLGMMFVLLHLLFMRRYLFVSRSPIEFCVALTFGLLAAGSKLEFAMVIGASILYVCVFQRVQRRLLVFSIAFLAASIVLAWAFFGGNPPGHHWLWDNILLLTGQKTSANFYAAVQGTDHLWSNLLKSLHGAAIVLGGVALLAGLDRAARSPSRWRLLPMASLAVLLAMLSVYGSDYTFFRAWSVLQLALVPLALREPRSPLAFLLVASLTASYRIFLNLSPVWYGFFLILPVYVLILYVLFELLPARGVYSRNVALAWIPLLLMLMLRAQIHQREIWSRCIYPVSTSRGTYLDWNADRAQVMNEFVASAGGIRSLVVIPESPTLNYFIKVDNPLWNQMFTPYFGDFAPVERGMISEFETKQPQYVAFVDRPVEEFGYRGFGIDYDRRLAAYIRSNYREVRSWHRPGFSLVLVKRLGS
jgi:hypothetical protein